MPSQPPKSTPRSTVYFELVGTDDGWEILAWPSGRKVTEGSNYREGELTLVRLEAELKLFRLDLIRPYGSCARCSEALDKERVCVGCGRKWE